MKQYTLLITILLKCYFIDSKEHIFNIIVQADMICHPYPCLFQLELFPEQICLELFSDSDALPSTQLPHVRTEIILSLKQVWLKWGANPYSSTCTGFTLRQVPSSLSTPGSLSRRTFIQVHVPLWSHYMVFVWMLLCIILVM